MAKKKRHDLYGRLERCREDGSSIKVTVREAVKGGLRVGWIDVPGVSAFLPASHIDLRRVGDLEEFVGREFDVLVESCDVEACKAVVSRRNLLIAQQRARASDQLQHLREGDVMDGKIVKISDQGPFVVCGDLYGMVSRYNVSWDLFADTESVRSVGDEVKARVVRVNRQKNQITFDIRGTDPDPWREYGRSHRVGQLIFGRVVVVQPHCAFFELTKGVYGFAHVSELTDSATGTAADAVSVGDEMWLKIKAALEERKKGDAEKQTPAKLDLKSVPPGQDKVLQAQLAYGRLVADQQSLVKAGKITEAQEMQRNINAARIAYEKAGVGPADLDLVELHDCFATAELVHYDNLMLCEEGGAADFFMSGATWRDGSTPVNVSGGLESKGHPIAATGIANIWEVCHHLRGEAGDRQIEGAKVGLAHVIGLGSACGVHILEKSGL